jgi:hypothetical protein
MNTNSLLARKGCEKCKLVDVDNINLFPLSRLVSLRARKNEGGRVQVPSQPRSRKIIRKEPDTPNTYGCESLHGGQDNGAKKTAVLD